MSGVRAARAAGAGPGANRPGRRPTGYLLLATHVPAGGSVGGMVRYTTELARHLAADPGVRLSVLAAPGAVDDFADLVGRDRVHVARGGLLRRSLGELLGDPGDLAGGRVDVVHGTKHLLPLRAGAGRRRGRRGDGVLRVLTVHDLLVLDRGQDYPAAKRWLLREPYRASLLAADLLVTDSAATRDRLVSLRPGFAARARSVPLAVSPGLLGAEPVPLTEVAGRRFALVVGDASARKNLATVVAAWPRVRAAHPGARLVHVGPAGWGKDVRGADYAALRASGDLVAPGHVGDGTLRWLYEHASVVLCPSLVEGFGFPAAEATAFGAPLVRSPDPALREAASGAGTEVDATDPEAWAAAVLAVLAEPAGGLRAPAATRTWDDVCRETLAAVHGALAARAGTASR